MFIHYDTCYLVFIELNTLFVLLNDKHYLLNETIHNFLKKYL